MPRRKDSFSRALADAQKRLEKAEAEKEKAQARLYALDNEIPALHKTIAALKGYFEPVQTPLPVKKFDWTGIVPPPHMTIEEQAKWYTERDLSGVSSIPPGGAKPSVPLPTEDELLPDDLPGKPVLEK